MLWVILNESWRQHLKKQQLYGHLPPIMKPIQVRRTGHAGRCWRSRDEFISNILLWTPSHGQAKAGWPARTYIQQFCADTGCSLEDLPGAMDDRDGWQEKVWEICAGSAIWWWWWSTYLLRSACLSVGLEHADCILYRGVRSAHPSMVVLDMTLYWIW